jgi:hypothetical protein
MGVLAAFRRAAVRAGIRVALAPDLHPGLYEALKRVGVLGLFETADGAKVCVGPGPVAKDSRTLFPNVNDVERAFGVTWGQLVELEPQLETLLGRARLAAASCRTFPGVERVFGPLRDELAALIGFAGKHPNHAILGSAGAYEVAYWKLYNTVAELLAGRAAGAEEAPAKQRGATVPGPCPSEQAIQLTWDDDPSVRAVSGRRWDSPTRSTTNDSP